MLAILFNKSEFAAEDFLHHEVNKSKVLIQSVLFFQRDSFDDARHKVTQNLFCHRQLCQEPFSYRIHHLIKGLYRVQLYEVLLVLVLHKKVK